MALQQFLEKVPIFNSLSKDDLKEIANGMGRLTFKKDEMIFEQGDTGDAFYVIATGSANVLVRPQTNVKLGDDVELQQELIFNGKLVPRGALGRVDKYDASRDYPYTVRLLDPQYNGQRGRCGAEEIELCTGKPTPQQVAKLKPGDYFGEQSLLKGKPRNATIKAAEQLECGVIDGETWMKLGLGEKLSFAKRKAVQTFETTGSSTRKEGDTIKTDEEKELIKKAIMGNKKLNEIIRFEDEHLEQLVASAFKKEYQRGDKIIEQGSLAADEFYVVKDGEYAISVKTGDSGKSSKNSDEKAIGATDAQSVVGTVKSGASFGELALLYQAPRAATVTCQTKGTLFVIGRNQFKGVLRKANEDKVKGYKKVIDSIELFNCLISEEKDALAEALVETTFVRGESIIKEGDKGDAFYILAKGNYVLSVCGLSLVACRKVFLFVAVHSRLFERKRH